LLPLSGYFPLALQVDPILSKLGRPLGEPSPALRSFFGRRGRVDGRRLKTPKAMID